MTASEQARDGWRTRRVALAAAAAIAGALAGLAGIYGIGGTLRNPADAACRPAVDLAKRLSPLSRGEVAALAMASEPRRVPELSFRDSAGRERGLSEWRGRVVLLNLWATWCVPCREEMPALDALEERLGGPQFEVVAVNIDTRNTEKARDWLKQNKIAHLAHYADPSAKIFQDLKMVGRAVGMPTTLLIDSQGCEVAYLAGPAEWASEDAVKLIAAAVGK
jgi:thiol-disulfide isomerase/thioredoxin